jgi:hypothetical protein
MLRDIWRDLEPDRVRVNGIWLRRRKLFSEQLHAVGSSLGGEGLNGWHSEQEGDPPGGRVPFKFFFTISRQGHVARFGHFEHRMAELLMREFTLNSPAVLLIELDGPSI